MKDMKLLFIARRFPPSVGGMERFAYDLSESIKEKERMDRITWGGSNKWLPVVIPGLFLRAVWQLATDKSYTIIHIQDALLSPVGWLLHVLFRKPFIVVAHGLDITYQNSAYQKVIPWCLKRASAVISISEATAQEVIKRDYPLARSFVVPLGIIDDTKEVPSDRKLLAKKLDYTGSFEDKKILITVGRFVKRKGVAWFIRNVLPPLVRQDDNVLYLVAGDGTERPAIEAAIAETGLEHKVNLLGKISDEARGLLYKNADVFVMPNIKVAGDIEGFGIVAHEAAVAGLPVVASDMEGIADALTNGKNGILLPSGDAKAYIKAITELLKSKAERHRFGKKARIFTLETFGWDRIADRYIEIYCSLKR
jgi:glycosyltransferase involved in cell wall biosynthesis